MGSCFECLRVLVLAMVAFRISSSDWSLAGASSLGVVLFDGAWLVFAVATANDECVVNQVSQAIDSLAHALGGRCFALSLLSTLLVAFWARTGFVVSPALGLLWAMCGVWLVHITPSNRPRWQR